jgi:hypothetical protein
MHWALTQQLGTKDWWLRAQTAENLEWLANNDGNFKQHLDRYKYPERYENSDRSKHREEAILTFLQPLNALLEKS